MNLQLKRNRRAFTLLEALISLAVISIIILGVSVLSRTIIFNNLDANKNEKYDRLYEVALYIENKIKSIDYFKKMNFKDEYNNLYTQYVFTDIDYNKSEPYNTFLFVVGRSKNNLSSLFYRAYNSKNKIKKIKPLSFKNNLIIEGLESFSIDYYDGLFKLVLVDIYGNEISSTVLSGGVYEE